MFPLNLQLTPTHSLIIAVIIKGSLWNVYLIQLSHVTINKRYFLFINQINELMNKDYLCKQLFFQEKIIRFIFENCI